MDWAQLQKKVIAHAPEAWPLCLQAPPAAMLTLQPLCLSSHGWQDLVHLTFPLPTLALLSCIPECACL